MVESKHVAFHLILIYIYFLLMIKEEKDHLDKEDIMNGCYDKII